MQTKEQFQEYIKQEQQRCRRELDELDRELEAMEAEIQMFSENNPDPASKAMCRALLDKCFSRRLHINRARHALAF